MTMQESKVGRDIPNHRMMATSWDTDDKQYPQITPIDPDSTSHARRKEIFDAINTIYRINKIDINHRGTEGTERIGRELRSWLDSALTVVPGSITSNA